MLGLLFSHMAAWCNSPEAAERYTRGFKLYQYHLENGISVADDPIPPAELGAFVAKRSEYKYREAMIMIGMPASPGRMFRAVGYLNVTQPSSYTIIVASEEDDVYGSIFANKKKGLILWRANKNLRVKNTIVLVVLRLYLTNVNSFVGRLNFKSVFYR